MTESTDANQVTLTAEEDPSTRRRTLVPTPHVFVVWAGGAPFGSRHSLDNVDAVDIGRSPDHIYGRTRKDGLECLRLGFDDPWMSGAHASVVRRELHFVLRDSGSKNGVYVGEQRIRETVLRDGDVVRCGSTFFVFRERLPIEARAPADLDESQLPAETGLRTLIPALLGQLDEVVRIAPTTAPILIGGPTGSGKELLARAVHARSQRSGPFIPVNCGALAPNLVEAELFGHRKGAFSGATEDRPGLVQASAGGTLFLDEIGELPVAAQAALLRVLQDGEVRAIGAAKPKLVDLRVVAATNRDLEVLIEGGHFRRDLYGRLTGYAMKLPPLCLRLEDFGLIAGAVLRARTARDASVPRFSPDAVSSLLDYSWPHNARELDHVLHRATTLADGRSVAKAHLPPELGRSPSNAAVTAAAAAPDRDDVRRKTLVKLLEEHEGNISAVARAMGKVRSQVQRWLKRYGIEANAFRSDR